MRALLLSRVNSTVASIVLTIALAVAGGLTAATWGMTLAAAVGAISIALIAFWPPVRRSAHPAEPVSD